MPFLISILIDVSAGLILYIILFIWSKIKNEYNTNKKIFLRELFFYIGLLIIVTNCLIFTFDKLNSLIFIGIDIFIYIAGHIYMNKNIQSNHNNSSNM